MRVLGIETSCDETSVAIVDDGTAVASNVIASSQAAFKKLAGVIPEEAARRQVECMMPVLRQAMDEAGPAPVDAIAVTRGPGLLGSLLVGTVAARTASQLWNLPLIGVHHTLGHLSSVWLNQASDPPVFPCLCLSASGGHTDLWYRTSHTRGRLIGRTRDDAAGEAFDKGASLLGLPYPGGPAIGKTSETGSATAHAFPLPLRGDASCDFSFSGLKTSLKYLLRDLEFDPATPGDALPDLAASFQEAICHHLLDRLTRAMELYPDAREVHIVGGVSANARLRVLARNRCAGHGLTLRVPATGTYCTDNAAMIAAAGFFLWKELGGRAVMPFDTVASFPLEESMPAA